MLTKSPLEMVLDMRSPEGLGGHWLGVFVAVVNDIKDPDGQGRVKVTLPWTQDTAGGSYETWARLATLLGGNNGGRGFVRGVTDEGLVAFEHGQARRA